MDEIKIHLLGRFEMLYNGRRIDEQVAKSRKGRLLLQYLLVWQTEAVPYSKLYEVLWPDEKSANPENALKTLVSRMRVALSSCCPGLGECIVTARGAYRWKSPENCMVDVFEFEKLCLELKNAETLTPENRPLFEQVLSLYTGDLLPENDQESWVVARSVYLQNLYMNTVYQYLKLLKDREEYEQIIHVCRRALEINAFDEQLHLMLMEALVRTNRNHEALMQYKHATNLHFRYLGVKPPEGIQEFYKQIAQAGRVLDGDLDAIRADLRDYREARGAFVCEYAVFKEIYNLQLRSLERTSTTIFLALLMVSSVGQEDMNPLKLDDIMKQLLEVLRGSLRKGDIITHYTASQYALLLPLKSYDNGKLVMERVKSAFYRQHANSSVVLNYRLGLISPEHPQDTER